MSLEVYLNEKGPLAIDNKRHFDIDNNHLAALTFHGWDMVTNVGMPTCEVTRSQKVLAYLCTEPM